MKKLNRALGTYRKATERTDASAMSQLGDWYLAGRYMPKDLSQAYQWFNRAAAQGAAIAVAKRDEVKTKLTPEQILQAQKPPSEPD